MYANANFDYFDPYNLLDFLNDLTIDRTQINHYNCDVFVRPLQVLKNFRASKFCYFREFGSVYCFCQLLFCQHALSFCVCRNIF